jgi:hypothetical protein
LIRLIIKFIIISFGDLVHQINIIIL